MGETVEKKNKPDNKESKQNVLSVNTLLKGFEVMCTARSLSSLYEANARITSKYVHATSKGHEAVQIALGLQLKPEDYIFPYYRDDSILLSIGITPYELMLQLLAKRDDPFSGGRTYYSHPSLRRADMPKIPHQSSATGMQAIPATGTAMGMWYKEAENFKYSFDYNPVTVCSLGDASVTEGEVAEAFQMAVLKKLPILYFVQDNGWDISANAKETRAQNAAEYARGFNGLEVRSIDGSNFIESYNTIAEVLDIIRNERRPFLIHAVVPLLNHHTSGVRMEWYRDDLDEHRLRDPFPLLKKELLKLNVKSSTLVEIEEHTREHVENAFQKALDAADPLPEDLLKHCFSPTEITSEQGEREPSGKEPTVMVDCALFAIREILSKHPEALLYGQDVGRRLGGVFREAATLAQQFGDNRVFNTPIQEAFIIGSTVGMAAVGLKPIVEVQFADYIWPGLNQLFTEISRSYYLSNGKWPASCVIRVPIGAYGSGGPYHSSSVESVLTNIRGIKIAYPSNGADLKGLMKSAFYDPNPVIMLEHKGLYWSKIKGTEPAKTIEPDENYIIPFGAARLVLQADDEKRKTGEAVVIITYGMGVYWSLSASKQYNGRVTIIDLRTLVPLDENTVFENVKKHGRALIVTEEPILQTFAQSLAGRISAECFEFLDAPVKVIGSENTPAIPLNSTLESTLLPNADKVAIAITEILNY
jgi:2-oxoisovalerate dehydrogenase E1 component